MKAFFLIYIPFKIGLEKVLLNRHTHNPGVKRKRNLNRRWRKKGKVKRWEKNLHPNSPQKGLLRLLRTCQWTLWRCLWTLEDWSWGSFCRILNILSLMQSVHWYSSSYIFEGFFFLPPFPLSVEHSSKSSAVERIYV